MDDDFEIEITDLKSGATASHPLARDTSPAPNHADAPADEPLTPLRPRRRQRQRAAIVVSVVVLAVVLVVVINPATKSSLYTVFRFPTPVPSPTPLPGANLVYLTRGAPWGHVMLDGKQSDVAHPGLFESWIRLTPGRHTILVTQPPFRAIRCTISMPAAKSDTCPLISPSSDQSGYFNSVPDIPSGSRFIDLGARFSLLSRSDQDALTAAADAEIQRRVTPATPVTLRPGDHYLRDDGSIAVARTTLQATFTPTLLMPDDAVSSDSQACVSFCDRSGIGMSSSASWDMIVTILVSWHISGPGGQVIANHAPMFPSDPAYEQVTPSTQVLLSILWTGQWQISERNEFGNEWSPACQTAQDMMSAQLNAYQVSTTGMGAQPGLTPEQGCIISLSLSDPAQSDPIYLFYHLGVLLAANDAAHHTFPALPVASANERALSRQLLAQSYGP